MSVGGKHLDAARLKNGRTGYREQDWVLAAAGAGWEDIDFEHPGAHVNTSALRFSTPFQN
jgi:hypothetical protein